MADNRTTFSVLCWSAFALAVIATIAATYSSSARIAALQHADFLYLPALYNDLFLAGGSLRDWSLPPSPYFFPDLVVYALLRLFGSSQDWTAIAAQVLMPTSIALCATYLARQAGSLLTSMQTLALLTSMLLAYAWGWSGVAVGFLCLSCHGGQMAMVLLCIALLHKPTMSRVGLSAAVSFATALSDPLFIMAALVPMSYLVWSLSCGWRARAVKLALVWGANLAGIAGRAWLPVAPTQPDGLFNMRRTAEVLRAVVDHFGEPAGYPAYLGVACAITAAYLCWQQPRRRAIVVALVLSILSTIGGLLLIGEDVVPSRSRYLIPTHVTLAILAPIGLRAVTERLRSWKMVFAAFLAVSALTVASLGRNLANIGRLKFSPLDCFDRFAAEYPVHRCAASYWLAKPMMLMARTSITAVQTGPDGSPYWWINTRRHYLHGVDIDCAAFPEREANHFASRYGSPQSSALCDGHRIMAYMGRGKRTLNERLQPVLRRPFVQ